MKQPLAVWGLACLIVLVLGTGAASGQVTGYIVGWGERVVAEPPALQSLVAVAGGHRHSLALKSDGTIAGWGYNLARQCDVPTPNAGFMAVAGG